MFAQREKLSARADIAPRGEHCFEVITEIGPDGEERVIGRHEIPEKILKQMAEARALD